MGLFDSVARPLAALGLSVARTGPHYDGRRVERSARTTMVFFRAAEAVVLSVGGALDGKSAPEVLRAVRDLLRDHAAVEIDLWHVDDIDAAGLRMLFDAEAVASERGRAFRIRRDRSPAVEHLLAGLGLDEEPLFRR